MPGSILVVAFGFEGAFVSLFLGNLELFPIVFATTTLGVCNVASRLVTIIAPLMAEVPEPIPQSTLFGISFIAMIISFFLKEKTKAYY